jgi:hypothetical protein
MARTVLVMSTENETDPADTPSAKRAQEGAYEDSVTEDEDPRAEDDDKALRDDSHA